jgi:hypothetical protein
MAQRVLAENAGVESVRYVLPNKHYIPVDMKYIGVDNTTPYVPGKLLRSVFGTLIKLFSETIPFLEKRHLPRVVEQKTMGCDGGGSFPRSDAVSPLLIYYAVRAWSTDAYPFPIFFSNSRQNAEVFTPVDAPR